MARQKCRNLQFMTSYYISDTFMFVSLLTNSNMLNHTRITHEQTNTQEFKDINPMKHKKQT